MSCNYNWASFRGMSFTSLAPPYAALCRMMQWATVHEFSLSLCIWQSVNISINFWLAGHCTQAVGLVVQHTLRLVEVLCSPGTCASERMSNVQTALNSRQHGDAWEVSQEGSIQSCLAPPAWEVSCVDGWAYIRALTQFKWWGHQTEGQEPADGKGQDYPVSGPAVASPCCCALQEW
jgi:hypothetical protein